MTVQFEADLDPETHRPRVRFNLANGWSVSVIPGDGLRNRVDFFSASVAACPSGQWGKGRTELLAAGASSNEVVDLLASVAARSAPQ